MFKGFLEGRHFVDSRSTLTGARALAKRLERDMWARQANPTPRVGTARPRRVSQVTKKPPTKRLVTRRKANVKAGYFPNPLPKASKTLLLKEYRMGLNAVAKEKHDLSKQAALSYSQGVVQAGQLLGMFSDVEAHSYRESLKKAAGI